MMVYKYLFIDRDGTLIAEPTDNFQVDRCDKLALEPDVIAALLALKKADYRLVMVSNQDGLGSKTFPFADFHPPHNLLLQIFTSQGITFDDVLICPHLPQEACACRKPKVGLVANYLASGLIDREHSYVIGDRTTDLVLAENMAIKGLLYHRYDNGWHAICQQLCQRHRHAQVQRKTKETAIEVTVWLDKPYASQINTGIAFFDHMLEQIATHANIQLVITAQGDLHIDDHHTIEDCALALGEALKLALGDKRGLARFGFTLPMDEARADCALDLSGRPYLVFDATFKYQYVGDMGTEMIAHFFHSLSYSLGCTLHLSAIGSNDHHRAESLFKAFARALRQAIQCDNDAVPSSKGVLL